VKTVTDAIRIRVLVGIDDGNRDWREEVIKLKMAFALGLKEELIPPKPAEDAAAVG